MKTNFTKSVMKLSLWLLIPRCLIAANAQTVTTLVVTPGGVISSGTVVTLTALVTSSAGTPRGTVSFCDPGFPVCLPGDGLYGTAQLTSDGNASLTLRLPAGTNKVQANFEDFGAASRSETTTVAVTPISVYPSVTSLAGTGSPGDYTLSGTVSAYGGLPMVSQIGLLDLTNSNLQIASVSLSNPKYALSAAAQISAGINPYSGAVGDLNNDGIPDVAVPDEYSNSVSILLGNGDGTFKPFVTYDTGATPLSVTIADFNRDGIPDLAVANSTEGTLSVLLGVGDGQFQPQRKYWVGTEPFALSVADFNGDGNLDLACANESDGTISVLLGNGDGTFQSQILANVSANPDALVSVDLNGDGVPDLAVATNNAISVLIGNGDGTFKPSVNYIAGSGLEGITVGDFNRDGAPDLVAVDFGGSSISVLLGNGDGTFQTQVPYRVGNYPYSAAVGDFNRDGIADLVVSNDADDTASILLGNGDGTFQPQFTLATGSGPRGLVVADFNLDGVPDLLISDTSATTVSVFLGQQSSTFSVDHVSIVGTGSHKVVANFGGDASRIRSQSPPVALLASPAVPVLSLVSAPNPSTFGTAVTLVASVSKTSEIEPTGTITFQDGSTLIGSSQLSGGSASIVTTTLAVGSHTITAIYDGDSNYTVTSSSMSQIVSKAVAAINLSSSHDPSMYGSAVTFSATLPVGATGTISFRDGDQLLGTVPLASGIASISVVSLEAGSHDISATYSGDQNFQ